MKIFRLLFIDGRFLNTVIFILARYVQNILKPEQQGLRTSETSQRILMQWSCQSHDNRTVITFYWVRQDYASFLLAAFTGSSSILCFEESQRRPERYSMHW